MYPLQESCRLTVIFHVPRVWWDFSTCYLVMGFTAGMRGPMSRFAWEQ